MNDIFLHFLRRSFFTLTNLMGDSNSSQEAYSDTTSTNTSRIADQNQLNLNVDLEKIKQ